MHKIALFFSFFLRKTQTVFSRVQIIMYNTQVLKGAYATVIKRYFPFSYVRTLQKSHITEERAYSRNTSMRAHCSIQTYINIDYSRYIILFTLIKFLLNIKDIYHWKYYSKHVKLCFIKTLSITNLAVQTMIIISDWF